LLVGLIVAAIVGACSDSTGVEQQKKIEDPDQMCPGTQVPVCTSDAVMSVARDVASDGSSRSVPALENTAARTALAASLTELSSALNAGNVTKTRKALQSARTALDAARAQLASFGGDAADLGAVELLLDHVAVGAGTS
jgi:hypothetical protein